MARINIEDQLFTDGRFIQLVNKHGNIKAIGMMVMAYRLAQTYWVKNRSLIPSEIFLFNESFSDIVAVGLAEKRDDKIYVCGSKEQFDWVLIRSENGKKGGRPKTKSKPNDNLNITKDEPKYNLSEPNDNPQSQSQSQSQSQVVVEDDHKKETEEVWNQIQYSFGYPRDLFDEVVKDAYLIFLTQAPETRKWKRFLSHYFKNEKEKIRLKLAELSNKESADNFSLEDWKNDLFRNGESNV